MTASRFDSIILDMDGTLWDAVDSYCAIWNRTIAQLGLRCVDVTYDRLAALMGRPLEYITDALVGDAATDRNAFLKQLIANECAMMPVLGGRLYPDVRASVEELCRTSRLFMVSNCGSEGLPNFLNFTGLKPFMTDWLSYGQNGNGKDMNIRLLVERYRLKTPLYVGDVQSDCDDSHRAGVPFAWASYGFGKNVEDADYVLRSFGDLLNLNKAD